ncbi:MAG: hypothetical protein HYU64_08575 [Armatimonadetes bacterium]|nr:hypothetical protein [Armatimonadota bacterium]
MPQYSFAWNFHAIPVFFAGVCILVLGLLPALQKPGERTHRLFFWMCFWASVWLNGMGLVYLSARESVALPAQYVAFFGVALIPPGVYAFTCTFCGLWENHVSRIRLAYLGALCCYVLALLGGPAFLTVKQRFWGYYILYGPLSFIFLFFFFSLMGVSFLLLFRRLKTAASYQEANQTRYFLLALALAYTGSIDFLPSYGFDVYPGGLAGILLFVLIITYAMGEYRLLELDTAIHRSIFRVLTASIVILPLYLILESVERTYVKSGPMLLLFEAVILYLILFLYFSRIQPLLDRLFLRREYRKQEIVETFAAGLASLRTLPELLDHIMRTVSELVDTREAAVAILSENPPVIQGRGEALWQVLLLPGVRLLAKGDQVLDLSRPSENLRESLPDSPAQFLRRAASTMIMDRDEIIKELALHGVRILVPLVYGQQLVGVVAVGKRAGGKNFSRQEIWILSRLRSEIALALSNSLLYEQVRILSEKFRKLSEQLEGTVAERTEALLEAQAALKFRNEELEQAIRSRTEFFSSASHELRTPLHAIIGFSDLLREKWSLGLTDEEMNEFLGNIVRGATHLLEIINDLLDLAKLEAGKMTLDRQLFSVSDVLEGVVDLVTPIAGRKNIVLSFDCWKCPAICADAGKFRQILINLLANAIKYTPAGGEVSVRACVEDGIFQLTVSDTGIGIRREDQKRIFDAFSQVGGSGQEGTGLGLAVTKKLVELHEGRIWVDSESDKGSRFTVIFPASVE